VAAQRAQVVQGALEQSNVNSIAEMGLMIQVLRAYEAYQKGIQAVDEMQSRAVNEVGRVV
jgi:flagellar basal-body rod protein FlgG